ncbi:Ku protein [Streptomyces violaceusniger]|uniref:Non-homologous end joining protein Ku n=1 Tax=Streptomyces violaceusniger (strain Tu 4113) TaxID=653045 RepID=G2NVP5_STRV4|nr:Ku protein [Streptomyces violaceusniger]AEM85929.1 DNA repair protein [Streptomyces violaceusniger Tu 4113]
MRPVWSGAVTFGLVTISVKMYSATEDHSIRFRQIHLPDHGLIRNRKVCELDGQVLEQHEIGRAYEASKDLLVPITDEDLDNLPLPTARAIDVQAFVPEDRLDAIRYDKPYYLEGDGAVAAKPYVLLREALKRSDKVAIAKFAFRGRERLGALRVVEDAIALQVMHWDDEIRSAQGIAPSGVDISDSEVDEAMALMDAIGPTDISQYRDQYREAMEAIIRAKTEGVELPHAEAPAEPKGKVVDLMSALQDSVRAARKSRGEDTGDEAEVHEISRQRAPKKSTAKKTTAKKESGSGKKTAAKKTSRKRPAS